ncbi:MAG: hypothetical protein ABI380_05815 [Edaphobacter sp.]
MGNSDEFRQFSDAIDTILKAKPEVVKSAMEQEKLEREEERKAKRLRERKVK